MTMEQAGQAPAATAANGGDAADRILGMGQMPNRFALEPTCFDEAWKIAQAVAKSGLCGITEAAAALVIIQTGRELGLSAMQSLRAIWVLDGKPSLYADAMIALVRMSGKCARWRIVESTAEKCTIETYRVGEDWPTRVEWTIEQARKIVASPAKEARDGKPAVPAKMLTDKDVWINYPAAMLRHRAASELIRMVYPDVCLGMYTPEELEHGQRVERIFAQADLPKVQTVDVAAKPLNVSAKPAASPPVVTPSNPPEPAPIDAWVAKFAAVKDADALGRLSKEVPQALTADPVLKAAFKAAKERLGLTNGNAPKTAAASAGPTAEPETASAEQILGGWAGEIGPMRTVDEVLAFHVANINEIPIPLRAPITASTARKLQGLGITDAIAAINAAVATAGK
jgi:hypothetical protein